MWNIFKFHFNLFFEILDKLIRISKHKIYRQKIIYICINSFEEEKLKIENYELYVGIGKFLEDNWDVVEEVTNFKRW